MPTQGIYAARGFVSWWYNAIQMYVERVESRSMHSVFDAARKAGAPIPFSRRVTLPQHGGEYTKAAVVLRDLETVGIAHVTHGYAWQYKGAVCGVGPGMCVLQRIDLADEPSLPTFAVKIPVGMPLNGVFGVCYDTDPVAAKEFPLVGLDWKHIRAIAIPFTALAASKQSAGPSSDPRIAFFNEIFNVPFVQQGASFAFTLLASAVAKFVTSLEAEERQLQIRDVGAMLDEQPQWETTYEMLKLGGFVVPVLEKPLGGLEVPEVWARPALDEPAFVASDLPGAGIADVIFVAEQCARG